MNLDEELPADVSADDPKPEETDAQRLARLRADLQVLHARGASPEIVQYYLKSRGHITTPEAELAKMPADPAVESPAAVQALGAVAGGVMKGIPGGKAAVAGLMSIPGIGRGGSFRENAEAIDRATGELPLVSRVGSGALGAYLGGSALSKLFPALMATPARAGATYGGLDAALSADDESLKERAVNTALGAGIGGAAGKAADLAARGIQKAGHVAKMGVDIARAPKVDESVVNQTKALNTIRGQRDALGTALREERLPAVVQNEAETFTASGAPQRHATSAQFAERQALVGNPSPERSSIPEAARELLEQANTHIAKGEGDLAATIIGHDAFRAARGALPGGKNLATKSPAAILDWLEHEATPSQQAKYLEGLLGAARAQPGLVPQGALDIAVIPPLIRYGRNVGAAMKMSGPLRPKATGLPALSGSVLTELLNQVRGQ